MDTATRTRLYQIVLVLVVAFLPQEGHAQPPTFSAYARVLSRHVTPGIVAGISANLVNYQAVGLDADYFKALQDLAEADLTTYRTNHQKIAFWINAYNLLAIKTVVDRYPMQSIRDGGNIFFPIWKRTAGVVAGEERSLDSIEHGILREVFVEPRVHMALVCASLSCPDLRVEVYEAVHLEAQLEDQARRFLANPSKGVKSGIPSDEAEVSSIFRWFRGDFDRAGGIAKWILSHADSATKSRMMGLRDQGISYLDYNWSLNDSARLRAGGE